jgi:erythromycin esterase-like protein
MSQDIQDFITPVCDLLGLGEPTHREPAFAWVRNELFVQLVDRGFRSFALESDRVAALKVNDFVQEGAGSLDEAMSEGFSHGLGDLEANRRLVAWMREYNQNRPSEQRLAFHGFDASTENTSTPSPRRYLEHARDYLGLDENIECDDERWSRTEAILDPGMSPGATAEAEKLRSVAGDMLTLLEAREPELVAATSRAEWLRAKTHLTAGLGLLRYHKQAAVRLERNARISRLSATRDALMAQNLLDIRAAEAQRGPTLVFAHNLHLRKNLSILRMPDLELEWMGAGAIVGALLGDRYVFVAGSLGRSETIELPEPEPDTYEGFLQRHISTWGLTTVIEVARTRTDTTPQQAYFPLDHALLDEADAVLHIGNAQGVMAPAL